MIRDNGGSRSLDADVISKGYIYFKKQKGALKNRKKEEELLMQLINPTFSSIIEVYGDPNAKHTTSFGVGGLSFAGGLEKSYYIKKRGKIFWLEKGGFEDWYDEMFGDSEKFKAKYPKKDIEWKNLTAYIVEYTELMKS